MKKIVALLIFFSQIVFFTNSFSQGTWAQKDTFPGKGRELPFCFVLNDKGYIGTGESFTDVWQYDPATNTWTQVADYPGAGRMGAVGFSINNKGYAGTGWCCYSDFYEYDPIANKWTREADFPGGIRGFTEGFSIGTKGYIGFGQYNATFYNDLWEWDQPTNVWVQKASLPGPGRGYGNGISLNGKGYIFCGIGAAYYNDAWEYDPVADAWTQKASLPAAPRIDISTFVICNKIYLGTGGESPYYNDFWEFDPAINLWIQKANVPGTARDDCGHFAINNKGYITLGQLLGTTFTFDLLEYTPDSIFCESVPACNFTASDSMVCSNNCISFTDLSSGATSWQWIFDGANPPTSTDQNPPTVCYTIAGKHNVTLIAANAGGSDTLTFSNYITVDSVVPPSLSQSGNTLYSTTDSSYASYQWYDSTMLISGATDTFLVVTHGGNYNVQVTDKNGCKIAVGINITGLQHYMVDKNISLFPNPVKDQVTVYGLRFTISHIDIYNVLGEKTSLPTSLHLERGDYTIDVSGLAAGVYSIRITDTNNTPAGIARFVKE